MKILALALVIAVNAIGCAAGAPPSDAQHERKEATYTGSRAVWVFGCTDPSYPVLEDVSCNAAAGLVVDSHAAGPNRWYCAAVPYDTSAGLVFRVEYTCGKRPSFLGGSNAELR